MLREHKMITEWQLDFISKEDFYHHVSETIKQYKKSLTSYDVKKFNSNVIDPIKLIFDKTVYRNTWKEIISNEIYRQRDKSNTNAIGYFHQNIFKYVKYCTVPAQGFDVIYENKDSNIYIDGQRITKINVEMKNKHNTMNSGSSKTVYINLQRGLISDPCSLNCLVEVIASESQNIPWTPSVDHNKSPRNKLIRRISIDKFWEMVTGREKAFFELCNILPSVISDIVKQDSTIVPNDTVYTDIKKMAEKYNSDGSEELSFALAIYMLGFETYNGFEKLKKD